MVLLIHSGSQLLNQMVLRESHTISGKYYLSFCHSIFEYKYVNERLVEAKLTTLGDNSYVCPQWRVSEGSDGTSNHTLEFWVYANNKDKVRLWEMSHGFFVRKEIFHDVYQKVKDLCEVSGLKLDVSSLRRIRKYAKWIAELS